MNDPRSMQVRKRRARKANASTDKVAPIQFDAALTERQFSRAERVANDFGVTRRVIFFVLARSSRQLLEGFRDIEKGDDALIDALERVGEYRKHLELLLKLATCAEARLLATGQALCDEEAAA